LAPLLDADIPKQMLALWHAHGFLGQAFWIFGADGLVAYGAIWNELEVFSV
jgi:hypothetical protein